MSSISVTFYHKNENVFRRFKKWRFKPLLNKFWIIFLEIGFQIDVRPCQHTTTLSKRRHLSLFLQCRYINLHLFLWARLINAVFCPILVYHTPYVHCFILQLIVSVPLHHNVILSHQLLWLPISVKSSFSTL